MRIERNGDIEGSAKLRLRRNLNNKKTENKLGTQINAKGALPTFPQALKGLNDKNQQTRLNRNKSA